jgi:HEPN domain-containing protein
MKNNNDFARLLLSKARQDAVLVNKLADEFEVADDIIGFHFQQVVEKSLKALLSLRGIEFRKTHDIRELLDIIADNRIPTPSWFAELDIWTPFAVEYRYEELPDGECFSIQRNDIASKALAVISYVEQQIPD